jgi:hypothetical protein
MSWIDVHGVGRNMWKWLIRLNWSLVLLKAFMQHFELGFLDPTIIQILFELLIVNLIYISFYLKF